MTPEETFTFINNFLTYIAPLIANNNGFIDKYTGDGLMAIFPEEQSYAFDAINSGLAIFKALKKINAERLCQNKHQIQIGIGIHSGPIMLGIIGEQRRYEGTVISDVVNTAARIEGLTKEYGQPLIISEPIKNQLPSTHPYELSQLEPINIRGKSKSVALYSVKID
jgi:class 3 adenylate cyclase